ncbi:P-loop containing nucleoside triphosphate hydrolase protein [Obba rivulosa]|uniref:P-loop containing nucleoside triphosphate hydrolase protein n=1 Tax=Obba rivulosa TaxID=1052685 RepID=A0A8E2AZH8_9APHY|nr:P-loop containing nucleoside triphosphate hydrolase protein [Obba rivulosa]
MASLADHLNELEDAFVKVTFEEDGRPASPQGSHDRFYNPWIDHASNPVTEPGTWAARALRKMYPGKSVLLSTDWNTNILGFPGAVIQPTSESDLITSVIFVPFARRLGQLPGVLMDQIKFGSFHVAWDKYDFILYIIKWPQGFGEVIQHFFVHDGPEKHIRSLILAAGSWFNQLHEEILVFNQGYWSKDHNLWSEVQKANWDDVILKDKFKSALRKDIGGFFESEQLYKSLSIPWKRGLIMYGPPGNGKTISMKAIMKDCDALGYAPLYVKSFRSWKGEEGAMADVFEKARQMAPCVVILEDLDSLINDGNRSFFLNQMDGLEGNDGLLVIGSTNHFDRLDPALSGRPSRFDRKYSFDDPDKEERALYVKYWQSKLSGNKAISFPDSLVDEVAEITEKFSFAYLKEAFVAALVLLAGWEGDDKPSFATVLKDQIKELRNQLDKDPDHVVPGAYPSSSAPLPSPPRNAGRAPQTVDLRMHTQARIWDGGHRSPRMTMPGEMPAGPQRTEGRDVRAMALAAAALGRSFIY